MRKTVFSALVYVLLIIAIAIINLYVFRSDIPMLWLLTLLGSVFGLLFFPYKTFFNNKQN